MDFLSTKIVILDPHEEAHGGASLHLPVLPVRLHTEGQPQDTHTQEPRGAGAAASGQDHRGTGSNF